MRPVTKSFISAMLGLLLLIPAAASASSLTSDQVNAIVSLLQSFGSDQHTITTVQMVLSGQGGGGGDASHAWLGTSTPPMMMGTSTMSGMGMPPGLMGKMCIPLTRNLGPGSKGDDVKNLQEMLSQDKDTGFTAPATGVFGPLTARAMMLFQMKNGIASSTTGTVGPLTRMFFEHACGQGMGGNGPGMMGTSTPAMMNGDDHREGPGMPPGPMGTSSMPQQTQPPMQFMQAH